MRRWSFSVRTLIEAAALAPWPWTVQTASAIPGRSEAAAVAARAPTASSVSTPDVPILPSFISSIVTRQNGDQSAPQGIRSGDEHDLADVLALGDEGVRRARLVERKCLRHHRVDEVSGLELGAERLENAIESLRVLPGEHVETEDALVLVQE